MNKKTALLTSLCLLVMTFAVSAQDNNIEKFMGEWILDADKSELGERSRVESMKMKVSETNLNDRNWLTVTKTTKRAERQEGERGIRGRMGRGRGGEIAGNNVETANYALDGKETKSDIDRGRMVGKATASIKAQTDGSMIIYQNTEFNTPRGLMKIKNTETWMLSADGKTLTVSNETETPRGNRNSKMVFFKSPQLLTGDVVKSDGFGSVPDIKGSGRSKSPSRIKGGVVNGKAISLPAPKYPAAAQAAGKQDQLQLRLLSAKKARLLTLEQSQDIRY